MKTDRFVKVMLVLVALLLALNCAKDLNSPSEAAAPPSFLQVGKVYRLDGQSYTILEVQNSGWVKAKIGYEGGSQGVVWVNTNVTRTITE